MTDTGFLKESVLKANPLLGLNDERNEVYSLSYLPLLRRHRCTFCSFDSSNDYLDKLNTCRVLCGSEGP
jgi:hypothetical protein